MNPIPSVKTVHRFDPNGFLASGGEGKKALRFPKHQTIFAQGDPADAVFYLQTGRVQLAVVSKTGKEVTIGILNNGSFFGEGSLAWPSSAHEYCNRHDGMLCSPN